MKIKILLVILLICLAVVLYRFTTDSQFQSFYRNFSFKRGPYVAVSVSTDPALQLYYEGKELEVRGKADEALVKLKKAVELSPRLGKAYLMIGTAYTHKNKISEAVEAFNKALSVDIDKNNEAIAHYNLGVIYLADLQNYSEAARHFQKTIELAPGLKHEGMNSYKA